MFRIMHLVNEVNEIGNGISNVVVDLAIAQRAIGHEVTVASRGGSYEALLESNGVKTIRIDFMTRNPILLGAAVGRIVVVSRRLKIDVIHSHTLVAAIVAQMVAALRAGIVTCSTLHNEYQRGVSLMRLSHSVVGPTKAVCDAFIRRGCRAEKVHHVFNGPLGSLRSTNRWNPVALEGKAVVTCGGLGFRKGTDNLIRAFELAREVEPELELYLVGAVNDVEILQVAAAAPSAAHIHFLGFQPDPRPYLASASVFVLPSRREPMGLVFVEAMDVDVPVIGTRVDGIPEVLDGGRAGVLVEADDESSLAGGILALILSSDLRRDVVAAARARKHLFTTHAMANAYDSVYSSTRLRLRRA